MGTTLTGTTPQDTYDSLIKVTDNGPLSGSLKVLTDGLGNNSALSLSTGAATITGTLGVSNRLSLTGVGTSELYTTDGSGMYLTANTAAGMYLATEGAFIFRKSTAPFTEYTRITSAGNVGIGTSTPFGKLSVSVDTSVPTPSGSMTSGLAVHNTGVGRAIQLGVYEAGAYNFIQSAYVNNADTGTPLAVFIGNAERARFTANGLTFNGDTAAANALDDYEEGTFSATLTPSTSGSITLNANNCSYTKIGRQVTIKGQLGIGSVSSPVGTLIALGGLPFTTINSTAGRGLGSVGYFPSVGSGSLVLNYQLQNATEFYFVFTASSVTAGDEFYITLTYFV